MRARDYYGQKLSEGMMIREMEYPKREGIITEIDREKSLVKVSVIKEGRNSVSKYITDFEPSENWQISFVK